MLQSQIFAQTETTPQVPFKQRTSIKSPSKTTYNIKGDFTMIGNTNLTLNSYTENKNNESNQMNYVDIDGINTTLNSSMATLELSNSGENSANQTCSNIIYAGLYWTGKSQDSNTFNVTKGTLTKNYDKKTVYLKGPKKNSYETITAKTIETNSDLLFPGTSQSGIFVGYQEVTDYVIENGPGAYTVADIALIEGSNSNPGYSGGWVMIVIYENPNMKSRAVTLFDGYAYVNGQLNQNNNNQSLRGEYGNVNISGFTTVDAGQVNMKLGVMAAEGDVNSSGDYLAVQKLNLDSSNYPTNYLVFNNTATPSVTNNFFNSSIITTGTRNPNYKNNTGIDINMFTVPNIGNSVIGNKQTSTNFRFGSTYEVFTIFGFAMSVDSYVPEPSGLISINSINNVTNPTVLNASPGQEISYSLAINNPGTEAISNTIVRIPIPNNAIFNTGEIILYNTANGFSTTNTPYYDLATKSIIWNLGTLPITAGHPEYVYANLSFKISVTSDCSIILNAGCNPEVSLETGTISGTGAVSGTSTTKNFFQGYDNSACKKPIAGSIKVAINSATCLTALAGNDQNSISCGLESVKLAATPGSIGTWSIVSRPIGGGELFSNNSSPDSEFFSPNPGLYTLRWTLTNFGSCPVISKDVKITLNACQNLDFDGTDDYVNFKNNYNLNNGPFSLEIWVKPTVTNDNNMQTILSKRNASNSTDGYDLRLVNNIISFNWNNTSLSSSFPITAEKWYHIAVTFDGNNYNLYIDGLKVKGSTGINPSINNNSKFLLGAMAKSIAFPYKPINYYKGAMQEFRIWNLTLNQAQIRQMMNQKIQKNNTNVYGSTIPLDISGISWTDLEGYYQMVQSSDILNGFLLDKTSNIRNGKLVNISTPQPETAPLPYTTTKNGSWEISENWTYGDVWNLPNSLAVDSNTYVDWNIVKIDHNITTAGNKIVLGLLVTNGTLKANQNSKLEISNYLKLDGKIDLVNRSQLIQTQGSILDPNSSGSIQKDQQGQANLFNYNYWSSPVGTINAITNNANYTVASVMKDGTTNTPQNITWISEYNGSTSSTPITISRYWLYKFDNYGNAYANWSQINENSELRAGLGYSMKGSGTTATTQNYTFIGKPNNGLINSNNINDKQLLLAGNPYPSSLDSKAFIEDNQNSIDGTIYLWEHYKSNNSHVLRDYQGGYAIRNLSGGIAPSSANVDFISKQGTPSKGIPNRFIPVGQAFFLVGKTGSDGKIVYNNNQRSFHKENDITNSNSLYKITSTQKPNSRSNENDTVIEGNYKKIRLGFNSRNDYHRQILLGFMNEKATNKIDFGYDAKNIENLPNDMYFLSEERQLVIQGVGTFDKFTSYPIGVKTDDEGKVKFMIDELENFDANQAIYIYDKESETYHNINGKTFEINLSKGEDNNRFFLAFMTKEDKEAILFESNDIIISHVKNSENLIINNHIKDKKIKKITLYTISGNNIDSWNIDNTQDQTNIKLRVKKKSTGVYIAKITTDKGDLNKKILIQ